MNTETNALSLDTITPTVAQLTTVVDGAKDAIEKFNPDDKVSMDLFKSRAKELQQARLTVKEQCKLARDEANAFAKKVIGHEKELLSIITPTEDTMKGMLDEIKQKEIREERMKEMPERVKILQEVDGDMVIDEGELLELDHDQFVAYLNEKKAEKFEIMQEAERKRKAEEQRQAEIKEAEERASQKAKEEAEKKAEEEKFEEQRKAEEKIRIAEQAKKDAEEALKRKEQEAIDAENKRIEDERRAKVEEEERKKKEADNKAYVEWLQKHGVVEGEENENLLFNRNGNVVTLYKKVDTFTFED